MVEHDLVELAEEIFLQKRFLDFLGGDNAFIT
jgi:hypothetical protein